MRTLRSPRERLGESQIVFSRNVADDAIVRHGCDQAPLEAIAQIGPTRQPSRALIVPFLKRRGQPHHERDRNRARLSSLLLPAAEKPRAKFDTTPYQ